MSKSDLKKLCFILGTRPEAIKMAPLIIKFKECAQFNVEVCLTGQHREMLAEVLTNFEIKEDLNLELMRENQSLVDFASAALPAIYNFLESSKPDLVFVHGDTSTALYASLAAFYHKIKIAHVEAGLRTHKMYSPFPEEMNRTLVGKMASYHFSPTKLSEENLLQENIEHEKIFVTGNTVIDALQWMVQKQKKNVGSIKNLPAEVINSEARLILITMHRRENFGDGIKQICEAILELANKNPNCNFVYPVHPNPNVSNNVHKLLSGKKNIFLIEPLGYSDFVYMMNKSFIILTDSGGVQEEAPGLGKPVLVLRQDTERPEAVDAGTVKLVGTDKQLIVNSVTTLLTDDGAYKKMAEAVNPYGDGKACVRIVDIITRELNG